MRRTVAPSRILVSTEAGFAVDSGWVVVASLESAGGLLMTAGWDEQPLQIVDVGPRARRAATPSPEAASLESLINQPTLTPGEAYRLLNAM